MGLKTDLYQYKTQKLYSYKKNVKDDRKNTGYDYSETLLTNSLSKHIVRNDTMFDFIGFLTDYFYNTIKQIKVLKNWNNYITEKEDKNIK